VAVSYIGGGNRSTRRKPSTCHKWLTNVITLLHRVHLVMWGIRTLVVIGTDCKRIEGLFAGRSFCVNFVFCHVAFFKFPVKSMTTIWYACIDCLWIRVCMNAGAIVVEIICIQSLNTHCMFSVFIRIFWLPMTGK
jgi:hypothetical protein